MKIVNASKVRLIVLGMFALLAALLYAYMRLARSRSEPRLRLRPTPAANRSTTNTVSSVTESTEKAMARRHI